MAVRAAAATVRPMTDLLRPQPRPPMRIPLVRAYSQVIEAPPETVFPLLCPTREGEWLEGWADTCELVWSASGVAEAGCVFRTTEPGRPDAIWIITEHDPDRRAVAFARVVPGLAAGTLRIEVEPSIGGTSAVSIRYSVVSTSADGEAYVAQRYDRNDLLASVVWWERSMNHFLQTGELLRHDPGVSAPPGAVSPDQLSKE